MSILNYYIFALKIKTGGMWAGELRHHLHATLVFNSTHEFTLVVAIVSPDRGSIFHKPPWGTLCKKSKQNLATLTKKTT